MNQIHIQDIKSIDNLVKELIIARERSVLGDYQESFKLFEVIQKKIQYQISINVSDQVMYDRWSRFLNEIEDEIKMVSEMTQLS